MKNRHVTISRFYDRFSQLESSCYKPFSLLLITSPAETLASKTINSRLVQNDELERDKG